MSYTTVKSNQEANQIMTHGNVINKDRVGGFTVEYEGKTYYIPKYQALLTFKDNSDLTKDITYWPQYYAGYYSDLYKKSENERKALKKEESVLKTARKSVEKKYNEVLARYNAKSFNDITNSVGKTEARKILNNLSDIGKQLRLNSARFMSACHDGLNAALKGGEWNNILSGTIRLAGKLTSN